MSRSTHATYTAADRYERSAARRPRACQSRADAIAESVES